MDLTTADFKTLNMISRSRPEDMFAGIKATNIGSDKQQLLEERAEEFEAVFLSEMLKPMWEGVETGGMFGGGQAEEIFRSLLIDEYAKTLASDGGIGVGDMVLKELIALQGAK